MTVEVCPIPGDDQNSTDSVLVGDEPNEHMVPFKVIQGVYHQLTGKVETIQKSYKRLTRIHFEDVSQLHNKIIQSCAQFNVRASNLAVTVYYWGGTKEEYTSFERFGLHCVASSHPVESVMLKYDFLILLPNVPKPQPYTISIRIMSKIIVNKVLAQQFDGVGSRFFQQMGDITAVAEVKYVDYTVARNFLALIDDWYKTVPFVAGLKLVHWIQNHPYVVPRSARLIAALLSGYMLYSIYPKYVPSGSTDLLTFGRFSIIGTLFFYLVVLVSVWASGFVENAFEKWSELSYIKITKGDERAIDEATLSNKRAIVRGVLGAIGTLMISIVASVVANIITK